MQLICRLNLQSSFKSQVEDPHLQVSIRGKPSALTKGLRRRSDAISNSFEHKTAATSSGSLPLNLCVLRGTEGDSR